MLELSQKLALRAPSNAQRQSLRKKWISAAQLGAQHPEA